MNDKKWIEVLKNCSPLDMPETVQALEFYNKQSAEKLMDEISEEFCGKEGVIKGFVAPAIISIIDSLSIETNIKYFKNLSRCGLTAERIALEFSDFSYEKFGYAGCSDLSADLEFTSNRTYNEKVRRKIDNTSYREKEKEKRFKDKQYIHSDYTNRRIYENENQANRKGSNDINSRVTEVDHIKPLKEIFDDLKDNIALDDKDIREIANINENLAYSERNINRSKRDDTNTEFVNSNKAKAKTLDDKTKETMLNLEKKAVNALERKQNEVVVRNIKNAEKRKEITSKIATKSFKDNGKYAVGGVSADILICFMKASFYEITDSIRNGIKHNTNTVTNTSAFAYRIKRIGKFILSRLKGIVSNSIFEFIKNLIISIIKGLINLFAGVIASIAKIVVKGINSIIRAIKILSLPESEMSWQMKADSIVKLISSTVILCCGDLVEGFINKVPFLNNYIKIVKPIIMGVLVALVGYLIDKMDLFNVKKTQRFERIKEVFNLRIKEIHENTTEFVELTISLLEEQVNIFKDIKSELQKALDNDDSYKVLANSIKIKEIFNIDSDSCIKNGNRNSSRRLIQF